MISISSYWLASVDYRKSEALQHRLWQHVMQQPHLGYVLLLEHPTVITYGYRGLQDTLRVSCMELARMNIPCIPCKRGGLVTLHHPGQLMIYIILSLRTLGLGVKAYVRLLETMIISWLQDLHIMAHHDPQYPGVWVHDPKHEPRQLKICAIGLAVPRGITQHGLALNICNPLQDFRLIHPCGIPLSKHRGITSVKQIFHQTDSPLSVPGLQQCSQNMIKHLQQHLPSCTFNALQTSTTHAITQGLCS